MSAPRASNSVPVVSPLLKSANPASRVTRVSTAAATLINAAHTTAVIINCPKRRPMGRRTSTCLTDSALQMYNPTDDFASFIVES
jgi:hypothetical protein